MRNAIFFREICQPSCVILQGSSHLEVDGIGLIEAKDEFFFLATSPLLPKIPLQGSTFSLSGISFWEAFSLPTPERRQQLHSPRCCRCDALALPCCSVNHIMGDFHCSTIAAHASGMSFILSLSLPHSLILSPCQPICKLPLGEESQGP